MKKLYFLIAFFAITSSLFSATVVYVNQSSPSASDENVGTDPASPWLTLNVAKWADDMIINVANGTYTISTKIAILNNVTLIGQSRSGVVLQSMDDASFSIGTTGNTLFQISGKTVSFSTMTIKNVRDNVLKLGGAFDVMGGAVLTLNDITFNKLIAAQATWSGGGAIMVRGGSVIVDNSLFEACQSNIGGAIMSFTNSSISPNQINITNSKFINNGNPNEAFFTQSHFGGAIAFSGKGVFNISGCYFEANKSQVNTSNAGGATGGAIAVRLDGNATSSLNITNSVFYKNEADGAGSVLATGNNGTNASTVFNLNMTSNVVFQNKGNVFSGTSPNTIALYSTGAQYTGTFVFANNTFFENFNIDRPNSNSILVEGMPVASYFINNMMNDNQTGGTNVYGLVCNTVSNSATLRRFKGNIFNHLGGVLSVSDAINFPDLFESNLNSTFGNRSWISNTYQKINSALTVPTTGIPFLETQAGGFGVNFGADAFLVNNVNVVPTYDIRGYARVDITDAGAFELGGTTTSIKDFVDSFSKNIYYNPNNHSFVFAHQIDKVQVLNLSGISVMNGSNCTELNVSKLPKAAYIVRTTANNVVTNHKIIKQ